MRIESFWAKGFRSLRDVRLEGLGPFCVFYGPNGSGKSNILEGIRVLFDLCSFGHHLSPAGALPRVGPAGALPPELVRAILEREVIQPSDLCARDESRTMVLGAQIAGTGDASSVLSSGPVRLVDLAIEYTLSWVLQNEPVLALTRLESRGEDLRGWDISSERGVHLRRLLEEVLPQRTYALVGANRALGRETDASRPARIPGPADVSVGSTVYDTTTWTSFPTTVVSGPVPTNLALAGPWTVLGGSVGTTGATGATGPGGPSESRGPLTLDAVARDPVAFYLRRGKIAHAFLAAATGKSSATSRRYDELRSLLEGEPLSRPAFRPVQYPETGAVELRERLQEPNPQGSEVPLELAGLGIAQIHWILGHAMLSGSSAIGIEEPEAHLHAPTTGLHLRRLLVRLIDDKFVDQLFIATHSNIFDLDPGCFWDVRLLDGETQVTQQPLDCIDQHLFEPGPTLHAFEELLKLVDGDRVMFSRSNGDPISASSMLSLLRASDPIALEYLADLT